MKTISLTIIFSLVAASLLADDTNTLSDDKSKASYAIGMMLGHNWQQQGIDVDLDLVLRGLKDAQSGGATLLTQEEMQNTLKEFQQSLAAKQLKVRAEQAVKNKAEGEAFLATNKNNPGIVTLPDGLQYKIIIDGDGATPAPADLVTVNYRGTFINGVEFDSSAKAGHPLQIQVGRIPVSGWTEALQQMKVGSKWQLFVPPALAYGERGRPGIPPDSTLIFDLELVSIQTPSPQTSQVVPSNPPMTSDIIKVPSADEMKKGAKVEIIKADEAQKLQSQSNTN